MNNYLISKIDAQFAFVEKCIGDCKRCDHNLTYPDGDKRCALIDEAPTVDAQEVRHGIWEPDPYAFVCSECHRRFSLDFNYSGEITARMNYCPHCGARMDGDKDAAR